ncbi:MAG: MurR/RpiR family transcriptional regulator [Clostridia bacterium]|nr:MurR/RpiR family transcriptional regulator [Clostridia bacterium]
MSCLSAIAAHYDSLTAVERKIADYIRANAVDVTTMPIAELAERAGVHKSAVIRCAKSLGFDGYPALKMALAVELSRNKQLNYAPYISPDDNPGGILDKIFAADIKTLHDTAERVDRAVYASLVERLHTARTIYIFGIGTSAAFVKEFEYRLMLFGYSAHAYTDVPSMRISTLNIREGDAAVGISHSGRTIPTIETLRLAKAAGALTACITSFPGSPITAECDLPITVFSDEIAYPTEALSARIAHLAMIDAITVSLSAKNYEKTLERQKLSHEIVDTVRYG